MDYLEWEPYYLQILEDFGFRREEDEASARLLFELLPGPKASPETLRDLLKGRVVTVLGNGPNLATELAATRGVVIAADEAVSVALENGRVPDVIVTDLDGDVEDILAANERGSLVVIHAHGDNQAALRSWAPRFRGSTLATTQSRPFEGIHNFGGFTDGDRAVFLAHHFGAKEIRLLGFDFDRPNEKDQPKEVKRRKLVWARKLIELLQNRSLIYYPSSPS